MLLTTFSLAIGQPPEKKSPRGPKEISVPTISLVYLKGGTPLDRECGAVTQKPVQDEWTAEVFNRLDEFQGLWDEEGTVYMQTALKEVGVPFPYKEMQATLTVCELSSMSSPLIIYVRRFLSSAEKPLPKWAFAEILFHEVMHTYTRDVYDASSLRKKYASESPVVLNHLHVMALEKFVLQKLNKPEMLEWVDNRYRNTFPPSYKRAWEIVNDIEGHEAFIKELKTMPTKVSSK
jgi:hypothetical protein